MHSSRIHTAQSLPYGWSLPGGSPDRDPSGQRPPLDRDPPDRDPWTETPWTETLQIETPWTETPWTETPWTETPLDRDHLDRSPPDRDPWTETPRQRPPCHVTCDTCWDRDPPVNRMTHRFKNITFLQTSFAGGKNTIDRCLPYQNFGTKSQKQPLR